MTVITMHEETPQRRLLTSTVQLLEQGAVILYPTDTVYAYGCDIARKDAIERIYRIREIHRTKPLSFIFSDIAQVHEYVRHMSDAAFKAMKRLLPGPYTFIFQASKLVPKFVLTKQKTVGVRIPNHPVPREIVRGLSRPILSASVVGSDGDYISSPDGLDRMRLNQLDLVIDCGVKMLDVSTVLDYSTGVCEVIRRGKGPVDW
jgi:tRNA threonylcarbamoyl adenosine modification protein (Sua5/YciO/YrdC/YwlC family)